MDKPQINFGDKFFIYGQFMKNLADFEEQEYNTVLGYITTGGYLVSPIESDIFNASIPGFVTEILYNPYSTVTSPFSTIATPFNQMEMVDVTDKLSLRLPLPLGTKVWMPIMAAL